MGRKLTALITTGMVIAFLGLSSSLGTLLRYYGVKAELINKQLENGKVVTLEYINKKERVYPSVFDRTDIGGKLAYKNFKSGKFDKTIEEYAQR